nr:ankyrin repeat domain-containing protein [Ramlibacter albus]
MLALALLLLAACGDSMSPLHVAVLNGDTATVRKWIAEKRNLDVTYDEKSRGLEGNYARRVRITPLMVAAGMGQLEMVKLLAEGGANIYAESNTQLPGEPRTAFDDAVDAGRTDIARYLWERSDRARLGARLERQITAACRTHCNTASGSDANANLVLFLLSLANETQRGRAIGNALCTVDPASPQARFVAEHVKPFPKGTLQCVAFDGTARAVRTQAQREAMIEWQIAQGADLDHVGIGYTPLMGAASTQDLPMLRYLLSRGAKPNQPNEHGLTAIGAAVGSCVMGGPDAETEKRMQPQVDVVEELLRAGADTRIYTPELVRKNIPLLPQCCNRQPRPRAQDRICEVFGMR